MEVQEPNNTEDAAVDEEESLIEKVGQLETDADILEIMDMDGSPENINTQQP